MALSGPFRLRDLLRDKTGFSVTPEVPTGVLHVYAGATAPSGYLLCDGTAVSRTTYAALYAVLGGASSPYGQGNGTTTFNLPDLRGRMPIGAGNEGVDKNNVARARGDKGGDTRLTEHTHTGTIASTNTDHTHSTGIGQRFGTHVSRQAASGSGAPALDNAVDTTAGMNSNASHSHTFTGGAHNRTQGNTSGDNMTPFLVTNYIIKT